MTPPTAIHKLFVIYICTAMILQCELMLTNTVVHVWPAHPIYVLALFLPCIKQVHGAVQTQMLHLLFERQTNRCLILTFTVLTVYMTIAVA